MRSVFLWFALLMVLAGCATPAPEAIREPPPRDLSYTEVRGNVDAHLGARVRWGGTIADVENRPDETWLYVVARPLDSSGRPLPDGDSPGRFIARVKGFLDPAVYAAGRLVTVAGTLAGTLTQPVGEYPYKYIVVDAEATKLWEPVVERPYYRDPFYDHPFFYDPFWPWPARLYPWHPYPFHPYWH